MKAFISYSHKDEHFLERLKVHLAPILIVERQKLVYCLIPCMVITLIVQVHFWKLGQL